jgi:hypothetical protein
LAVLRNRWYYKHDYHFGLTRFILRQSFQRRKGTWARCRNSRVFEDILFLNRQGSSQLFFEERTDIVLVLYMRVEQYWTSSIIVFKQEKQQKDINRNAPIRIIIITDGTLFRTILTEKIQ